MFHPLQFCYTPVAASSVHESGKKQRKLFPTVDERSEHLVFSVIYSAEMPERNSGLTVHISSFLAKVERTQYLGELMSRVQ